MEFKKVSKGIIAAAALAGAAGLALRRLGREPFEGRVALVTGASRGLGFLIARELLSNGARVAICARSGRELARAERELRKISPDVLSVEADITRGPDQERLLALVENRFGPVDILVNNAGIMRVLPFEDSKREDFERSMDVMFWAPYQLVRRVLPSMRARGDGRIVNITSIGGLVSVPHLLPYSCAKFAFLGFSEGLQAELSRSGVSVTTVIPGTMRTGSHMNAQFGGDPSREFAWFAASATLPLMSVDATAAARKVVAAAKRRQRVCFIGIPARVAALVRGAFPGLTAMTLAASATSLPEPTGRRSFVPGKRIDPWMPSSFRTATRLGRRAAEQNLELRAR